jgi:hypothetical protein
VVDEEEKVAGDWGDVLPGLEHVLPRHEQLSADRQENILKAMMIIDAKVEHLVSEVDSLTRLRAQLLQHLLTEMSVTGRATVVYEDAASRAAEPQLQSAHP